MKWRRLLVPITVLGLGGAVFAPGVLLAGEAKAFGSCGADCLYSCCGVTGMGCSCYCSSGYAHCGCTW